MIPRCPYPLRLVLLRILWFRVRLRPKLTRISAFIHERKLLDLPPTNKFRTPLFELYNLGRTPNGRETFSWKMDATVGGNIDHTTSGTVIASSWSCQQSKPITTEETIMGAPSVTLTSTSSELLKVPLGTKTTWSPRQDEQ